MKISLLISEKSLRVKQRTSTICPYNLCNVAERAYRLECLALPSIALNEYHQIYNVLR